MTHAKMLGMALLAGAAALHVTHGDAALKASPPAIWVRAHAVTVATRLLQAIAINPPPAALIERMSEFPADEPLWQQAKAVGILVIKTKTAGKQSTWNCTGVAIAADIVISNAHCVPTEPGTTITEITFHQGYVHGKDAASFKADTAPAEYDTALDYALLRVAPAADGATPYVLPDLRTRAASSGERLLFFHHSNAERLQVTRTACRFSEANHDTLAHSCAMFPGASGSLVLSERDHAVLALNRSRNVEPNVIEGFATPMPALLEKSPLLRGIFRTP